MLTPRNWGMLIVLLAVGAGIGAGGYFELNPCLVTAAIAAVGLAGLAIAVTVDARSRLEQSRYDLMRAAQMCPHCGYTIRARTDQCPECGMPTKPGVT